MQMPESSLRAALEGTPDAFYLLECRYDQQGHIRDFIIADMNASAERQSRRTRDELIGHGICELFPEIRADDVFQKYIHVFETTQHLDEEYFVQRDHYLPAGWYHRQIVPLPNGIAIFNRDISERKQAEALIRNHRQMLLSINNNIREGIYRITPKDGLIYANNALITMFGYASIEEFLLVPPEKLFATEGERQRYLHHIRQRGESKDLEVQFRRKDGSLFWGVDNVSVICDPNGEPLFYDGAISDITERKQTQETLREQERLLIGLQKEREMEALRSEMMTTITHEFRTPLAIILSSSELLDRYYDRLPEAKRREQVDKIRQQVTILGDMLKDLSLVNQGRVRDLALNPVDFDLHQLSLATIGEISATVGKNHHISFSATEGDYWVHGDRLLIRQMILNLLSNAVKYSPAGATVQFQLSLESRAVTIQVQDEGSGIHEDDLKRVFEPFHRGQNVQAIGGVGLGLSIVRECVELHEGSIKIDTHLDVGTAFVVRLPIRP